MFTFVRVVPVSANSAAPVGRIWLDFGKRCVSRQRVRMEDGTEAGLILPRGTVLRDGDMVASAEGITAEIRASLEELSEAACPDARSLARLAYHLGNRHASLMLGERVIRYPRDPVLDRMVMGLGHELCHLMAPFEPESGAYEFTVVDAMVSLRSMPPEVRSPGKTASRRSCAAIGSEKAGCPL